jgi:hypothetical protein
MKLTHLLKKITPLPWLEVSATDGDKWIGTERGDDRIATLDGNTQSLDHVYLVHAANILPELVKAAQEVLLNASPGQYPPPKRSLDKLRAAIAKAQNLKP